MAQAALQFSFTQTRIDAEKGVIYGVKVIELGPVQSQHGPPVVKPEHVQAFKAHAGNRSIPVHWTHDYLGEDSDRLHAKVGALKNFHVDAAGDLCADFHVAPTEYKEGIFWSAVNDPDNMMFSVVFSYDPAQDGLPLDFQAADLVERGAATTAMFSATTNTMTQDEIKSLVAESVKTALSEYAAQSAITRADEVAKLASAESLTTEIAALKADLANVEAKAEAKAKEVASAELVAAEARFSAAIGKSATFKPEGDNKGAITRAEFNALDHSERSAFFAKGGKLKD